MMNKLSQFSIIIFNSYDGDDGGGDDDDDDDDNDDDGGGEWHFQQ